MVGTDRHAGLIARPWLEKLVEDRLKEPSCRIVLLVGEPGTGKTSFVTNWAEGRAFTARYHVNAPRPAPGGSGDACDVMLTIGHQFAQLRPELFAGQALAVDVQQRVARVGRAGRVRAVHIEELLPTPFTSSTVRVVQDIDRTHGSVAAVEVGRHVVDPRVMDLENLQHFALFQPAAAAVGMGVAEHLVVVVDALDEMTPGRGTHVTNFLEWLEGNRRLPTNLRLVLASRPAGQLLETLRSVHREQLLEINLAEYLTNAKEDLRQSSYQVLGALSHRAPPAAEKLWVETLVEKAQGNFLFVDAVLRDLFKAADNGTPAEVPSLPSLNDVPTGLAGLYDFLLRKLQNRTLGEVIPFPGGGASDAWTFAFQPVLGILAVAAERLGIEDVARFSGLPVSVARMVCRRLASLLDDGASRRPPAIALFHSSFAEFLNDARGWGVGFAPPPSTSHKQIADALWSPPGPHWLDERSNYTLRYLCRHLRGTIDEDATAADRLTKLLLDPGFLIAQIAIAGVDFTLLDLGKSAVVAASQDEHDEMIGASTVVSICQGAFRVGMDPACTLMNGLISENVAPTLSAATQAFVRATTRPGMHLRWQTAHQRPVGLRQLGGLWGTIFGCAIGSDGDRIATAGIDGEIRVWDRQSEAPLRVLRAGDIARCCAISPDSSLVIGGYSDGAVAVWGEEDDRAILKWQVGHSDVFPTTSRDHLVRKSDLSRACL